MVRQRPNGDVRTLRKALRRILEHDWEHLAEDVPPPRRPRVLDHRWQRGQKWVLRPPSFTRSIAIPHTSHGCPVRRNTATKY